MTPAIVDVRLVQRRTGRWSARIDGRPVAWLDASTPSEALAALARAVDGLAWRLDAPEAAAVGELGRGEIPPGIGPGEDRRTDT